MTRPPNILVLLTDDHAQWAAHCYGNRELRTPSMDYLAKTGALFQHAFTPCPVCSPARACFLTGRLPSAHGIHDYIDELNAGAAHPGLTGQDTLPQRLQAAGYQTALVGKYHCNHFRSPPPGWDTWFTLGAGTNARFAEQTFYEGDQLVRLHGHQAPILTDRACRFITERDRDRPFFCYVGYTDTHTPHAGSPERLVAAYRDATFDDIPAESFDVAHGYPRIQMPRDDATRREWLAQYYAAVTMIDEHLGRLLDALDNAGVADDTLVIYTSDHGHMNGHHDLHTKGNATVPQNVIDESIRIPCIARWPGRIAAGARPAAFVDHCDAFATVLDAAGVDVDAATTDAQSPGRSWLPLAAGVADDDWKTIQVGEYGNARWARSTTHKLVRRCDGPNGRHPDACFDLQADPRETTNVLQTTDVDVIARLDAAIADHFARYARSATDGARIADQPRCNHWQPWEVTPHEIERRRS